MQINLRFWGWGRTSPVLYRYAERHGQASPFGYPALRTLCFCACRVISRYALRAYRSGHEINILPAQKRPPPVRPACSGRIDPHTPGLFGICRVGFAHRLSKYKKVLSRWFRFLTRTVTFYLQVCKYLVLYSFPGRPLWLSDLELGIQTGIERF